MKEMNNLKKLRVEKNMTMEELGDLVGVQRSTISKYEKGIAQPSQIVLTKLAKALNTSTDFLLELTENSNPPNDKEKITQEEIFAQEIVRELKKRHEFDTLFSEDPEIRENFLKYIIDNAEMYKEMMDVMRKYKK